MHGTQAPRCVVVIIDSDEQCNNGASWLASSLLAEGVEAYNMLRGGNVAPTYNIRVCSEPSFHQSLFCEH